MLILNQKQQIYFNPQMLKNKNKLIFSNFLIKFYDSIKEKNKKYYDTGFF